MSRRVRVSLIALGSIIALVAIAVVAVIGIGNSDWLREKFPAENCRRGDSDYGREDGTWRLQARLAHAHG